MRMKKKQQRFSQEVTMPPVCLVASCVTCGPVCVEVNGAQYVGQMCPHPVRMGLLIHIEKLDLAALERRGFVPTVPEGKKRNVRV